MAPEESTSENMNCSKVTVVSVHKGQHGREMTEIARFEACCSLCADAAALPGKEKGAGHRCREPERRIGMGSRREGLKEKGGMVAGKREKYDKDIDCGR